MEKKNVYSTVKWQLSTKFDIDDARIVTTVRQKNPRERCVVVEETEKEISGSLVNGKTVGNTNFLCSIDKNDKRQREIHQN